MKEGTVLLITGLQPQPAGALERSGVLEDIGEHHVYANVDDALAEAQDILASRGPTPARGTPTRDTHA
jgi:hypothetical protein